jgi:hypothetical protein
MQQGTSYSAHNLIISLSLYSLVDQVIGVSSSQERGKMLLRHRASMILSKCMLCLSIEELSSCESRASAIWQPISDIVECSFIKHY